MVCRSPAARAAAALAALAVAAAVVAVATAPPAQAGGTCHNPIVLDAHTTLVEMKQLCFTPAVARVDEGGTVVFRNTDSVPHTATGLAGGIGGFDQLTTGQQLEHRFDAPGVFPYYCVLHPGMIGAVVVGDGVAAARSTAIIAPPTTAPTSTSLDAVPAAASPSGDDDSPAGWVPFGVAGALVLGGGGYAAGRARRRVTG